MEKPIIFNAEMINAILSDRKTMTRRIIKPQPVNPKWSGSEWIEAGYDDTKHFVLDSYKKGMNLWVRETFAYTTDYDGQILFENKKMFYRATDDDWLVNRWRPSIFMPRWASRISLEIIDVRVERLQDITKADALAEGIGKRIGSSSMGHTFTAIEQFHALWDSINKKHGYGWDVNPFCWCVSFKRI